MRIVTMIKWKFERVDLWQYKFQINDEFNTPIYFPSKISLPAMPIIIQILTDYLFAKEINNQDKIFDIEGLNKDDQMDILLVSLSKIEDID